MEPKTTPEMARKPITEITEKPEKPTAMGSDATAWTSDWVSRGSSPPRIEIDLMSLYLKENAAKSRERQINRRNFQVIAPKKSQTSPSSLRGSIDDDPEWDPIEYEEDLMWNLPDPIRLAQLNQYHQSYEYYKIQFPSEDGQFDDVASVTEMMLRQ